MHKIKILLAGQGGQGVLSAGRMLTECGMENGKEVSYLPSYGAEMRGGTANCSVILSDEPIASPLCHTPDILFAMNAPSFHKFCPKVVPGGMVLLNSSISDSVSGREDISLYSVAANELAIEAGDLRSANNVMLGKLCALVKDIDKDGILKQIEKKFHGNEKLIAINTKAFNLGYGA